MSNEGKKSIVGKIIDNMKADASAQHEIDKANFAAVKADSKARHDALTTPSPDFVEFKEAKGIKGKAAVLAEHAERDAKEIRAQSREDYAEMLKKQRENINDLTHKGE